MGSRLIVSPMLFGRDIDRRSDTRRYSYADPISGTGLVADGRERETESKQNLNGRLSLDWKQRRPGQGETCAQLMLQGESETGTRNEHNFDAADTLLTSTRTRDTRSGQGATFKAKHSQALADTHLAGFGLEARYKTTPDTRSESVNGVDSALGAQSGVRQESPRHAANLGADYDWAAAKLSFVGNLSYSSGYTREANPDTEQTQRARTHLDLYAVKKLDRALSLRLSIDNVTREGRGDDSLEYSGALLGQREIDRVDGVRVVNLSLEGKW